MKKISVIVPMYFEEQIVNECYQRLTTVLNSLKQYDYEIIAIDDGSRDKTLELLQEIANTDHKLKVISFSRNFGHQAAVTAGLRNATGDVILIIDSDMQDPPELLPDMLQLWEQGYEVIYGKRRARKGETAFKTMTASMFYKTLNVLSDVDIPRDTGDFRLVDRKVVDTINQMPEHNKFLRGLFSWVGYKQKEFDYDRQERFAGETKYPLKKMLKLALDGIISFSTKPLKILGMIGAISIVISFMLVIYALVSYIWKLNELSAGWTSIMVAITFFGGVQLLSIWLMSEYIARIYDETRKRPEYIIDKKINFENTVGDEK